MKYLIIGLGSYGAILAEKLTRMGNEVIGVDIQMSRVETIKDKISHAIQLDATEVTAFSNIPLKDTDVVVVGIGEDVAANIMATAMMKQLKVKRLISRAVSPLQEMVLGAMGVEEITHPEGEAAERWATKLNLKGVVDSFDINWEYGLVEAMIPKEFDGKTLQEVNLREEYDLIVLSTIRVVTEKNDLGGDRPVNHVQGVASAQTVLRKGDIMVLYGHNKNVKRFLEAY